MKTPSFRRILIFAASLLLSPGVFGFRVMGTPGDVDLTFDPGSGVSGTVNTVVLQADGKLLIGGDFTTVKGLARSRIARLNPDGSGDAGFRMDLPVEELGASYSLAVQSDGKVLAGHSAGITRLNPDGSPDGSFSANVGEFWEDGGVYSIVVQPDGKVLIGGYFSTVNGTTRNGIARLNANGSLDRDFFAGAVLCCAGTLALQPDGKLLVLGVFSVNGTNRYSIARLNGNGTLDATFTADEEVSSPSHMALQPDGRILVEGYFTSGGYGIVRLNADGSMDDTLNASLPVYEGFPNVASLTAQPDGKVLVSGPFTSVNAATRNRIARLNADGSLDVGFDPDTGPNSEVLAVALQPDGSVILCGTFATATGARWPGIIRLHADGSLDDNFQPGAEIDGRVTSLVVQPDGKALAGGSFTTVGGFARPGIARLDADGSLDRSFEPAIRFYATASHIRSVALHSDGRVIITGIFATQDNDVVRHRTIARLNADGSLDESFEPDLSPFIPADACPPGYWSCERFATADTALVQPDGRVIVSGSGIMIASGDEAYDYFVTPFLARFHPDSRLDVSFQFGAEFTEASVQRMMMQPDGKLLVAGRFMLNGAYSGMTRLHADGRLDETFTPEIGIIGSYLNSMALQSDGRVIIGGMSSWMLRDTVRHAHAITRLNADGSLDETFHPVPGENDTVQSLVVQPDGKVLIAGVFPSIDGANAPTVARLNADGSHDAGFHGPSGTRFVMAAALQPDGHVLIGGDFITIGSAARPHAARLIGDSSAPSLSIALVNDFAVLTWPATAVTYQLRETSDLSNPGSWSPVTQPPVVTAEMISVPVPVIGQRKFFRLASPQTIQ